MEATTYYHGSPFDIAEGELLLPGSDLGRGDEHEEVYITQDLHLAQQFATWDGWIYQVEPVGDVEVGITDVAGRVVSATCSAARVVRCVW